MESPRPRPHAIAAVILGVITSLAVGSALGRASVEPAPRNRSAPDASDPVTAALDGDRPTTGRLVGDPPVACGSADRPITISQDRADGPAGIVATWFEQEQALAQTFTPPADGLQLVEFAPTFDYALGPGATVSIHATEVMLDPTSGRELVHSELDSLEIPSGEPARIKLASPVPLECGATYSIVIRPRPDSELSVQATVFTKTGNVYRHGAMFIGRPGDWEATGGEMRFEVVFAPVPTA
jgi:hypothetical protein